MSLGEGYFDCTASMMLSHLQEHGKHEVVDSSKFADVILIPELFRNEAAIAPLIGDFSKVTSCCLLDRIRSRHRVPSDILCPLKAPAGWPAECHLRSAASLYCGGEHPAGACPATATNSAGGSHTSSCTCWASSRYRPAVRCQVTRPH